MGGSGGGFSSTSGPSPQEMRDKLQKSKDEQTKNKFEREVSTKLGDKLKKINDRDAEQINQHLETIKKALEKEIEGTVDLCFGGSVDKHTYVDGLSDVDSLVLLNKSELSSLSPDKVKEYFMKRLQERLPDSTITAGAMAVTVKFKNHEIQLLPAVKKGDGFLVSKANGKEWSSVRPRRFADKLTKANTACGQKLIPTIKLAKAIIANLPKMKQLSGYHVESLATSIFSQYKGANSTHDMLKHFFKEASTRALTPVKDKTGQSVYVDSYLKGAGSLERKIVSDSLSRISRKMSNADSACNKNAWDDVFGEY